MLSKHTGEISKSSNPQEIEGQNETELNNKLRKSNKLAILSDITQLQFDNCSCIYLIYFFSGLKIESSR